jgi:hypothetical protein
VAVVASGLGSCLERDAVVALRLGAAIREALLREKAPVGIFSSTGCHPAIMTRDAAPIMPPK